MSMAKLRSPHVAKQESATLAVDQLFLGATCSCSGLAHADRLAFGDHDVGVVQEPVEHGQCGGVLGQEAAPGLAMPPLRRGP
jgi:hypothetical protein